MNEVQKKERLDKDVEIAIKCILNVFPEKPIAILLCGGYGRNEGAWYEDSEGKIQPYNDYDFVVIGNKNISTDVYRILRSKIAKKVGITWIDIDFYKPKSRKFYKQTIKNADLVYASQLVYGDKEILNKVNIDMSKIGKADIVKLYVTRIWTFLGSWKGSFSNLDIEEARFFRNQMAKAVLAACDMLLISMGKYTPSYKERVAIVCENYTSNEELINLAKWALNEKMNPSSTQMNQKQMQERYWGVKKLFCNTIQTVLPNFWRCFANTKMLKVYLLCHSNYILHIGYELLIKHSMKTIKEIDIFCAQNYIFLANDEGAINKRFLYKGAMILKRWDYIDEIVDNWDLLRTKVAWARNNL